jgi:hypothetical protein
VHTVADGHRRAPTLSANLASSGLFSLSVFGGSVSTAATIVLDRRWPGADDRIGTGRAAGRITLLLRAIRVCIVAMGVRCSVCMAILLCCTYFVTVDNCNKQLLLMLAHACNLSYKLQKDCQLQACELAAVWRS